MLSENYMSLQDYDVETLAHLVKLNYLPTFKKDIESCNQDDPALSLLKDRYNEVEKIVNKILPE